MRIRIKEQYFYIIEHLFLFIFIMTIIFYSVWANTLNKVVYGNDDRLSVDQVKSKLLKQLGRITAAQIEWTHLDINGNKVRFNGLTLQEDINLCSSEKFANEKSIANCSGFLIAPDLLLTAGHCVETIEECHNAAWVFDYVDANSTLSYRHSVRKCVRIIKREQDPLAKLDYAIIQLDRKIRRKLLPLRKSGEIMLNAPLAVAGFPTGLALKFAANASVRDNTKRNFFIANLDTFAGNSGSPVINLETGKIEGILVSGEEDFSFDTKRKCKLIKRCSDQGCEGESVMRITSIHSPRRIADNIFNLVARHKVEAYLKLKKDPALRSLLERQSDNTLLHAAILSGNYKIAKLLLADKSFDINQLNKLNESPFFLLIKTRDPKLSGLIKLFLRRQEFKKNQLINKLTPLLAAGKFGNLPVIKALINHGVDINQSNSLGHTALSLAILNHHERTAKFLISHGASLFKVVKDHWTTALIAAKHSSLNFVKIIYSNPHIEINNQRTIYGHTPLMLSISNQDAGVFNYFLNNPDINLNAQRSNGETALHIAVKKRKLDKFFKLVENGARTDIKDSRHRTALDLLRQIGRSDLVRRLNSIENKRRN